MIKDKFKEIVKIGIHPALKKAGFKKKGNHFTKKLEETQQVVTLQLSQGNSYAQLRFYFRCGILINGMKPEPRDLKSEPYADFKFSITTLSDKLEQHQFDINKDTIVKSFAKPIEHAIESDLIPFFKRLETESECINFLLGQPGLQVDLPMIRYLCAHNRLLDLENYVLRLVKFLMDNKSIYSDPNIPRRRIDRYISLINDHGKMTADFRGKIDENS